MTIKHYPVFPIEKVIAHYTEQDGVPVEYVCTTDLALSGDWEYSQSHHDYKQFQNGSMIDGGRQYIRSSGHHVVYTVKDGEFVSNEDQD